MYSDNTIRSYLNELASRRPTPGGGSAAALVGATGVALLSKVANFTIGKEKYKAVEEEMKDYLGCCESLRESFNKLCSEDAMAYKKLSDVFKLPKGQERQDRIQAALRDAIVVPLEACKGAYQAIKFCLPLAEKGNVNLMTDIGDAALMLNCAFRAALLNVEVNLKSIKDEKFVLETREILKPMEEGVRAIEEEVLGKVDGFLLSQE